MSWIRNSVSETPCSRRKTGCANSVIQKAVKLKCDGVTTVLRPVVQFVFTTSNPGFDEIVLKEESVNKRGRNRSTMPYNCGKLLMQVEVVDLSDQQKEYDGVGGSLTK
jgi:hypothetical protein